MKNVAVFTLIFLVVWTGISFAQESDIKDVVDPLAYPIHPVWITVFSAVAGMLLAALIWWLIKLRRDHLRRMQEVKKLPWEIATEQLEALLNQEYLKQGRFDRFYEQISDILRHYIENQLLIRAVEMTTEEFLVSLKDDTTLSSGQKDILERFMQFSDIVKFAKHTPTKKAAQEGFDLAKRFIEETRSSEEVEV